MNRKKIMALVMAMAMVGMVAAPSITSEAAGLTQATDPSQVVYGTVSEEDIELLRTLFDAEWYLKENPELADFFGNDTEALFKHFYKCGLFEGRTCSSLFDPAAYASAYGDLEAMYGNDILKYYEHYIKSTPEEKELRPLTTVAACAQAGVTVHSMVSSDVQITPIAYMIAERLGTNDYGAVQSAVNAAVASAKTSGDSGSAVISTDSASSDSSDSSNSSSIIDGIDVTLVATINADGGIDIGIYKGASAGYGAWTIDYSNTNSGEYTLIASTEGYEPVMVTVQDLNNNDVEIPDITSRIGYIPVYAPSAQKTSGVVISTMEEAQKATSETQTNGTAYSETNTIESGDSSWSDITSGYLDANGTDSTTYNISVGFGACDDSSAEVNVVVEGSDGFELLDSYNLDANYDSTSGLSTDF